MTTKCLRYDMIMIRHVNDGCIYIVVTTLNFHILRVATNVSCSSIMRKYNSYMNIVDNVNFKKRLKQLLLWKTHPWSYVFKYEILKFKENKNKYKII